MKIIEVDFQKKQIKKTVDDLFPHDEMEKVIKDIEKMSQRVFKIARTASSRADYERDIKDMFRRLSSNVRRECRIILGKK